MIGKTDLETETGKAQFEEYRQGIKRFMQNRRINPEDAEELSQEVCLRVLQNIADNKIREVDGGYFMNTAKFVLLEFWRAKKVAFQRFDSPAAGEESENSEPLDSEAQALKYPQEKERLTANDCLAECYNELNYDERVFLWRYSFDDEKHRIESGEAESNETLFGSILESIRNIGGILFPFQTGIKPMSKEEKAANRQKIRKIRTRLAECLKNCLARKKGFA